MVFNGHIVNPHPDNRIVQPLHITGGIAHFLRQNFGQAAMKFFAVAHNDNRFFKLNQATRQNLY